MVLLRRLAVVALLAVWSFPAVSLAKPEPAGPPPLPALVTSGSGTTPAETAPRSAEAAQLAAREQQDQRLQSFQGGEGVSIYIGGGALTLVLVIVLIVLLV